MPPIVTRKRQKDYRNYAKHARELKAQKGLIKDKHKAESKGNYSEVAQFCNAIGEIYSKLGRYDDAVEEHQMELRLSEALEDVIGSAVAHRKIGECRCDVSDYVGAVTHQRRHLELSVRAGSDVETQRAHATLGRTYLLQYDSQAGKEAERTLAKAELSFYKSLEVCQRLKQTVDNKEYNEMKCRLLLNLGIVDDYKGDSQKCQSHLKQAISIAERFDLPEDLYRCQYMLSDLYERSGMLGQALRSLETALKMAAKTKNKILEWDAVERKARVFVQLKDFKAARKCLKKRLKSKPPSGEYKEQLEKLLHTVRKLGHYDHKLSTTDASDHRARLHLSEKTGDTLANCRLYKAALKYYHLMLDHAEALRTPRPGLIPVYVSLAQTYKDDKQYTKALVYYRKEIDCRQDEPQQKCRTYLNIAESRELSGVEYEDIAASYTDALREARTANDTKLEFVVLRSLRLLQKLYKDASGLETTAGRLSRLQDAHGYGSDDEMDELDSQDTADASDHSDASLEDFTDSDTSDEEEYDRTPGGAQTTGRARRMAAVKRNEKGETPLHRACIDGKLRTVQTLLEKGHPVNPRDYCGWLPLHEAANHGHGEVVEALLDGGAWINDRGGAQCGGVTPLHDAASCGNMDIVCLLVRRGANVHCKDDEGNIPLDSLQSYKERAADSLSRPEMSEVLATEKYLKQTMQGNNPHLSRRKSSNNTSDYLDTSVVDDIPSLAHTSGKTRKRSAPQSTVSRIPALEGESQDSPDFGDVGDHALLNPDMSGFDELQDPDTASRAYRNAMRELGSAAHRPTQSPHQEVLAKKTNLRGPALVDEQENIGDDWLIDDTKTMVGGNKRKRGDVDDVFKGTSANKKRRSSSERKSSEKRRSASFSEDVDEERIRSPTPPPNFDEDIIDFGDDDFEIVSQIPSSSSAAGPKRTKQLTLTQCSVKSATQPRLSLNKDRDRTIVPFTQPAPTPTTTNNLKFRVKIKDKTFLVPISKSDPPPLIAVLASEASERYYKHCNLRPRLSLMKDGAILSADEPIEVILSNNEEVEGIVDSWDLPPFSVRYKDACKAAKTAPYTNIASAMTACEGSQTLRLSRLSLRPDQFFPVARALQCENLRELLLQGNRLSDAGFDHLARVLPSLPCVSVLSLCSNDLGCGALRQLVECVRDAPAGEQVLQSLATLDLSHNPLGDPVTLPLTQLLTSLPTLTTLRLASCGLTMKLFQNHKIQLMDAMKAHSLQHLDLSYNNLGPVGVELLLTCVNHTALGSLTLASVIKTYSANTVTKHVYKYLTQADCALQTLCLDACCIGPDMVPDIASTVSQSPSLQSLSLSTNSKLTQEDVRQILHASIDASKLQELTVNGCHFSGGLGTEFIDTVSSKLYAETPLKTLEFGICFPEVQQIDEESLQHVWTEKWGDNARCSFRHGSVKLGVIEDVL